MSTAIVANLQLIYVSDIARSTAFYQQLFAAKPVFTSPQYVAFAGSGDALFALWSGTAPDTAAAPRYRLASCCQTVARWPRCTRAGSRTAACTSSPRYTKRPTARPLCWPTRTGT